MDIGSHWSPFSMAMEHTCVRRSTLHQHVARLANNKFIVVLMSMLSKSVAVLFVHVANIVSDDALTDNIERGYTVYIIYDTTCIFVDHILYTVYRLARLM